MADIRLEYVEWPIGTPVGAYPRISEQHLDDMPPTMVQVVQTQPVAADSSLTFTDLTEGDYWACAPLGDRWQYISFRAESNGKGGGGAVDQGAMRSFIDANGDFWLADNAVLEGGVWNRVNESKYAYAMQWIVNGIIPGEELIDPIGGIVFWRCIPGANPIGPFASFGGWENIYLVTQYRDFVIGGQAIEIDGAGTFPFGRVIHAPEGTWLGQNAYADFNGRDDPARDSLVLGVFGDEIKARLWPANVPKAEAVDLLTLSKSGDLWVAGDAPGPVVHEIAATATTGIGASIPLGYRLAAPFRLNFTLAARSMVGVRWQIATANPPQSHDLKLALDDATIVTTIGNNAPSLTTYASDGLGRGVTPGTALANAVGVAHSLMLDPGAHSLEWILAGASPGTAQVGPRRMVVELLEVT